ncbi:MAG: redox-regulated ATPase YchF [Spirochaetales bacterium]|nr:redox-regulated ATPase YchF [Spirochaetales bacterium]
MSLKCGIVGLPNVGKSTLFSALTAQQVPAENYPFCTIEPNRGMVEVPDTRMAALERIYKTGKVIPAVVEFVDIAGLVRGASKGEGLGNRFLAHIREVDLIIHLVRCFEDEDVAHVSGALDPVSDIEVVCVELALADLETVETRIEKNERNMRSSDKKVASQAAAFEPQLQLLKERLSAGEPVRDIGASGDEQVESLNLIIAKPVLYVCNVAEEDVSGDNALFKSVCEYARAQNAPCLPLCCKLEAEIAMLDSAEERREFLEAAGLEESGLNVLVRNAYTMLGLRTFFTENGKELRAWTVVEGETAKRAAGKIHTDMEAGFIKAEVYNSSDLIELGNVHRVREAGKLRIEGKEYEVQDGDVVLFRFNAGG